jgi:starch synthase
MVQTDDNAHARSVDIDNDGEPEIVLRNQALFVVVTPAYGGRIVAMYSVAGECGAMVVGNPCDDWNWMEELNRYMDVPRNHPGALADVGFEHDRYEAEIVEENGSSVLVRLTNVQEDSRALGLIKEFELQARSASIQVRYHMPPALLSLETEFALSPDYLQLLRSGTLSLETIADGEVRGCRAGGVTVWVSPKTAAAYAVPYQERCGHASILRLRGDGPEICLELGVTCTAASDVPSRTVREKKDTFMEAV